MSNGVETTVRDSEYDLARLEPGEYRIRVRALDLDGLYAESSWSETTDFTRATESGLSYRLIDSNSAYEVVGIGTASGDVVVESEYRGKPVTSIAEGAFYGARRLTSITIPDSVTSIGAEAFQSCSALTSVTLPSGLTSIGDNMFAYCRALTQITIPDGVTSIGERAFFNCEDLQSITIPGQRNEYRRICVQRL